MSDRLSHAAAWNRARALKLHEHFQSITLALQGGARLVPELARVARLLDHTMLHGGGITRMLKISKSTITREWYYWQAGGREGSACVEWMHRPEALLCAYKAGCGGHRQMPRLLVAELQRRMTLQTGGRDKAGKSPISVAWESLRKDFAQQRPLPGVDYEDFSAGAEFPWSYSTACRRKAPRTLRALGNRGASAHKGMGAYVSLDYASLRKGELYTLDDVRLDIVCIDEATGRATEVVCYVFMEVGSRSIVGYVMKPAAAIKQEDVDELLAHMLQVPGYGIGIGYITHVLFERGTVACSEAAQSVLEGVTDGRIKVHRTGMVGGVRWIGAARDRARGNSAGKAVIESFNRSLHYSLLHLPGQRGHKWETAPENLGDLNGADFYGDKGGTKRTNKGTLIDEAEQLAQFNISTGVRLRLALPMLYLMQVNEAVAAAIKRHNTEPGHDYRGHGTFHEQETAPGVWEDADLGPVAEAAAVNIEHRKAAGKKTYTLRGAAGDNAGLTPQQKAIYWSVWKRLADVRPDLDRHAITRRVLGSNKSFATFTPDEFRRVLSAFSQIAKKAAPANQTK